LATVSEGVWKCVALTTKACATRTSSTAPAAARDRTTLCPSLFSFSPKAPERPRCRIGTADYTIKACFDEARALFFARPGGPARAREGRNRRPLFRVFFEEKDKARRGIRTGFDIDTPLDAPIEWLP
jgi:hypothetical protein